MPSNNLHLYQMPNQSIPVPDEMQLLCTCYVTCTPVRNQENPLVCATSASNFNQENPLVCATSASNLWRRTTRSHTGLPLHQDFNFIGFNIIFLDTYRCTYLHIAGYFHHEQGRTEKIIEKSETR